jgi:hypothetical protein
MHGTLFEQRQDGYAHVATAATSSARQWVFSISKVFASAAFVA